MQRDCFLGLGLGAVWKILPFSPLSLHQLGLMSMISSMSVPMHMPKFSMSML